MFDQNNRNKEYIKRAREYINVVREKCILYKKRKDAKRAKKAYIQYKCRGYRNRIEGVKGCKPVNHRICDSCKGRCCQRGGCGLMPWDIADLSVSGIKKMLDTDKYNITFYIDGIGNIIPIMQVKDVGANRIATTLIKKQCSLWNEETGCPFSDKERPTLGLLFIPKPYYKCELILNMSDFEAWYIVKPILEQVILEETGGKSIEECFYEACFSDAKIILNKIRLHQELTDTEIDVLDILIEIYIVSPDDYDCMY